MTAYYNEIDPYAAAWLRNLIQRGLIADGIVDERSIRDVKPEDLEGFTQCHFFAGIGGWSLALRMAGWPDDRPVWTGSCPCQPFSTAGKQKGKEDDRHLWPVWSHLIRELSPPVVFGEQVAAAITHGWLDDVVDDMEAKGYAVGAAVLPACSVGAPHKRDRLWFVGNAKHNGSSGRPFAGSDGAAVCYHEKGPNSPSELERTSEPCDVANASNARLQGHGGYEQQHDAQGREKPIGYHWARGVHIDCPDGKQRLIEPSIPLLVNGVPARVGRLRAYGNAIVPQVAAEFIKAFQESKRPNRLMEDLIG